MINIGIEPTAHWRSLCFHFKKYCNQKKFQNRSFDDFRRIHRKAIHTNLFFYFHAKFTSFSWKFNAELKSEERFKKIEN